MKKIILPIILTIALTQQACNKDDHSGNTDDPITFAWRFTFRLVDSAGVNHFDSLPPNFQQGAPFLDTIPFDPAETFFLDGLGQKNVPIFRSFGDLGMTFLLLKGKSSMIAELDSTNSSTYQWLLYLHANRPPDTIRFENPDFQFVIHESDYITFNSDTIFKKGQGAETFLIQYP